VAHLLAAHATEDLHSSCGFLVVGCWVPCQTPQGLHLPLPQTVSAARCCAGGPVSLSSAHHRQQGKILNASDMVNCMCCRSNAALLPVPDPPIAVRLFCCLPCVSCASSRSCYTVVARRASLWSFRLLCCCYCCCCCWSPTRPAVACNCGACLWTCDINRVYVVASVPLILTTPRRTGRRRLVWGETDVDQHRSVAHLHRIPNQLMSTSLQPGVFNPVKLHGMMGLSP